MTAEVERLRAIADAAVTRMDTEARYDALCQGDASREERDALWQTLNQATDRLDAAVREWQGAGHA